MEISGILPLQPDSAAGTIVELREEHVRRNAQHRLGRPHQVQLNFGIIIRSRNWANFEYCECSEQRVTREREMVIVKVCSILERAAHNLSSSVRGDIERCIFEPNAVASKEPGVTSPKIWIER